MPNCRRHFHLQCPYIIYMFEKAKTLTLVLCFFEIFFHISISHSLSSYYPNMAQKACEAS